MIKGKILGFDPGNVVSALVLYDPAEHQLEFHERLDNPEAMELLVAQNPGDVTLAMEMVAGMGMTVGQTIFDTAYWIGRFVDRWVTVAGGDAQEIYRREVKMTLLGNAQGNDPIIRQACIERFGGTSDRAIGGTKCKKCKGKGWFGTGRPPCPECEGAKWEVVPGPLYGVASDEWQALAVALAYKEALNFGAEFDRPRRPVE